MSFSIFGHNDVKGTDSISNISLGFNSPSSEKQTGGFFWNNGNIEKEAIRASKEVNCGDKIVEFLVDQGLIKNFGIADADGNTLLHILVSKTDPDMQLIGKILKRSDIKSFINKQNNEGDTAIILATGKGNSTLAALLERSGADKSIKNKKGQFVDTETDSNETSVPIEDETRVNELSERSMINPQISAALSDTLKALFSVTKPFTNKLQFASQTSEPATIRGMTETEKASENAKIVDDMKEFIKKYESYQCQNQVPQDEKDNGKSETEDLMEKIQDNMKNGGNCGCDTDRIIEGVEKFMAKQLGGKSRSNKVTGVRKINNHFEGAIDGSDDRSTKLSNLIERQSENIHERTVDKILKIMNDNKKDFKNFEINRETANSFKSLLWNMVKEKNPQTKSNLDLSIELEKMTTLEVLKGISPGDVKERIDLIKSRNAEKDKMKSQKSKPKTKPAENETTSSSEEKPKKTKKTKAKQSRSPSISRSSSEEVDTQESDTSFSMSARTASARY